MPIRKSAAELNSMRHAGRIAAETMAALLDKLGPGVTTSELNALADATILRHGALSSLKGVNGFPGAVCVDVNEQVADTPPGERVIEEGDVVSLDVGVNYRSYHATLGVSVGVGRVAPVARKLLEVTAGSLLAGIAQARAGNSLSDITTAVRHHVESRGFSVIRDFGGHGIGLSPREEPSFPHYAPPDADLVLEKGLALVIRPHVAQGHWKVEPSSAGLSLVTADGSLAAYFEHTVAITENGAEVLTRLASTDFLEIAPSTRAPAELDEALQKIRQKFAANHFLGWRTWLEELHAALGAWDFGACHLLLDELRHGYPLTPDERLWLEDLCDAVRYRQGLFEVSGPAERGLPGRERRAEPVPGDEAVAPAPFEEEFEGGVVALWSDVRHRLAEVERRADPAAEALALYRMGLLYQHLKMYGEARPLYERSLALSEERADTALTRRVEEMLFALKSSEQTGEPHQLFLNLWERLEGAAVDPERELKRMVAEALAGEDWPRAREAVSALESLGDPEALQAGLRNPSAPVRVAAVTALRRMEPKRVEPALVEALESDSATVRWQAALALSKAGEQSVPALVRCLERDRDMDVKLAAIESLGRVGDSRAVPALRKHGKGETLMGQSLSTAAQLALRRITATGERNANYVGAAWLMNIALLGVGAYVLALIDSWMIAGYIFYALLAKVVLEPGFSARNFFYGKPCYTGPGAGSGQGPHARAGAGVHYSLYLPLILLPAAINLLLLVRQFSWGLLIPPLLFYALMEFRRAHLINGACHRCAARGVCPVMRRRQ